MKDALKHYEYITGILYKQFGIKPPPKCKNISVAETKTTGNKASNNAENDNSRSVLL